MYMQDNERRSDQIGEPPSSYGKAALFSPRIVMKVLISGLVACFSVSAQSVTGTITGVVKDPAGAVITGAKVTGRNAATNATTSAQTDPQIAQAGGQRVCGGSNGGVWYNTFIEGTGNNWTGWVNAGGTLSSVTAAASTGPQLFLTGRDGSNQLWWYETPGAGWKFVGAAGLAAGPLSASPR